MPKGWGTFILPRAVWIFVASVEGPVKIHQLKVSRPYRLNFKFPLRLPCQEQATGLRKHFPPLAQAILDPLPQGWSLACVHVAS